MSKRIFCIVLDSLGIGNAPDAAEYGDAGSNTLAAIAKSGRFHAPNLTGLGLFHIVGVADPPPPAAPAGAYARLREQSRGKDTTTGHWELAGIVSEQAMPTYPDGLPADMIAAFEARIGRKSLCHLPYSGTDVIRDYGEQHLKTGCPIVYTSADSVFQIAANEAVVPLGQLYEWCVSAREMLRGDWALGRVIARPFVGDSPENFTRTAGRHDYSLLPPAPTVLNALQDAGLDVIGVGKIYDIFAGSGVTESIKTGANDIGMAATKELLARDFNGLCFVNLVDFDMVYGHRNDVDGYAGAVSAFDAFLGGFLPALKEDDLLMITADHGCDPSTPSTDHSREDVPLLVAGPPVRPGVDCGVQVGFGTAANLIASYFSLSAAYSGGHLWEQIAKP